MLIIVMWDVGFQLELEGKSLKMTIFHDEIEIEDFEYDDEEEMYYYPCPCGDRFQISKVS